MSNQLEKLKNSIKKEYTDNFELNLMKSSGFVPVDKRGNDFYVIINKNNLSQKTNIESIIKEKYADYTPKFIPVESSEFEEIIKSFEPKPAKTTAQEPAAAEQSGNSEPTAEEMLVGIGWITHAQLSECQKRQKKLIFL